MPYADPERKRAYFREHHRRTYTPTPRPSVEERFFAKVDRSGDCWVWTGAGNGRYGMFWNGTAYVGAHRWSYEHHIGPIPDGFQIHHLCHVGLCVNPEHLQAMTGGDNVAESNTRRKRA